MKPIIATKNVQKKLDRFFTPYPLVTYKTGDMIMQPADTVDSIFYIKKGYIRAYTLSQEGEEFTLHIARPGSYFPIMLILAHVPNTYYWQATNTVETHKAPQADVVTFLKQEPTVLFDLSSRFAAGLCGLLTRVEDFAFDSSYNKVLSVISYLAKRYGKKEKNKTVIQLKLTHSDLAAWTGLSRETVTRQIALLEKAGIVSSHNKLLAISLPPLHNL